jgi:SagB-type dehydrogenase family enzyme
MMISPILSFREGVSLSDEGMSPVSLSHPGGRLQLGNLGSALSRALRRLGAGGATLEDLAAQVTDEGGLTDLAGLYYLVQTLGSRLALRYTLVVDGAPLLTVEPTAPGFTLAPRSPSSPRMCLSRFAICRRRGADFIVETPLCAARTALHGYLGASLLVELSRPRSRGDLLTSFPGLTDDTLSSVIGYLEATEVLAAVDEGGAMVEDTSPRLMTWEPHDLLFHTRSRRGRYDDPVGGLFRLRGKMEPLPAVKPRAPGEVIPLHRPDPARLEREDPPLVAVMEQRRSIRSHGDAPITVAQLGELLHRAARIRGIASADPERGMYYEQSDRPYPCGGAAYELEIYLTVDRCEGLSSAIYHYDPQGHALTRLSERRSHIESLLRDAWMAAGQSVRPQVLITLTSRLGRLGWKYSAMAYATTLKHVGVLIQNLYLAATAMGLAPCGLGNGDSALVAEAMGLDALDEPAVGEMMLGSRGGHHVTHV